MEQKQWESMSLEQKLEFLKDKSPKPDKADEEFFLIWNGAYWCAGYMNTMGIVPEMDITVEVMAKTIDPTLDLLLKKINRGDL